MRPSAASSNAVFEGGIFIDDKTHDRRYRHIDCPDLLWHRMTRAGPVFESVADPNPL